MGSNLTGPVFFFKRKYLVFLHYSCFLYSDLLLMFVILLTLTFYVFFFFAEKFYFAQMISTYFCRLSDLILICCKENKIFMLTFGSHKMLKILALFPPPPPPPHLAPVSTYLCNEWFYEVEYEDQICLSWPYWSVCKFITIGQSGQQIYILKFAGGGGKGKRAKILIESLVQVFHDNNFLAFLIFFLFLA